MVKADCEFLTLFTNTAAPMKDGRFQQHLESVIHQDQHDMYSAQIRWSVEVFGTQDE